MGAYRVQEVTNYLVFTFESVYNLNLAISKLVKKCTVRCLSSDKLATEQVQRKGKSFAKTLALILRGRSLLHSSSKSDGKLPGTRIHNSKSRLQINGTGYLQKTGLYAMLEGKKYR